MTSLHPAPDYRALGTTVASLRHGRGWSLDRLAEASGVSRKSIINVENAHHVVRVETLWGIAHGLQVPVGDLANALYGSKTKV